MGWFSTIIQSQTIDETGYVQPKMNQLRAVRGTKSIYHNNAIQSWKIDSNGEVSNVQVSLMKKNIILRCAFVSLFVASVAMQSAALAQKKPWQSIGQSYR